jgi:hypothetical protein
MLRGVLLPLTERVCFQARLGSANRLQIPKCVRLRYKLETDQYLKVFVNLLGVWGTSMTFQTRLRKDGKIAVPKLNIRLLKDGKLDFTGYVANVTLDPL